MKIFKSGLKRCVNMIFDARISTSLCRSKDVTATQLKYHQIRHLNTQLRCSKLYFIKGALLFHRFRNDYFSNWFLHKSFLRHRVAKENKFSFMCTQK